MNDDEEREFCNKVLQLSSKFDNLLEDNPTLREACLPVVAKTLVNLLEDLTANFEKKDKLSSTYYVRSFGDDNEPVLISFNYGKEDVETLLLATGSKNMKLTEVVCILNTKDDIDYESVTVH